MEKKFTEDNQLQFKTASWKMEEDSFEFEEQDEKEENRQEESMQQKNERESHKQEREKNVGGSRRIPSAKSQKRKLQKKSGEIKNQIIFFELAVVLILAIVIIITTVSYNRNMNQVLEAIADLTKQESALIDEVMLLNKDIQNLQSLQESLLTAASEETIRTYDADGNEIYLPILANVPKHPYDWTCLQSLNGRKNYIINGQVVSKQGIDVSSFQGEIDWEKVKADGIDFAIIRLGYRGYGTGRMMLDEYFEANINGALEAGLEVGVYYFSQAISEEEAVEEAQIVLEHIRNYHLTYPIIYDAEEIAMDTARTDGLTVRQLTDNAIAFCEYIEAAGYHSMIYSNKRWLLTKLDLERLIDYDVWFAGYISIPEYPYDFKIWQYSESGTVNGIEGNVDLNISFMDYRSQE